MTFVEWLISKIDDVSAGIFWQRFTIQTRPSSYLSSEVGSDGEGGDPRNTTVEIKKIIGQAIHNRGTCLSLW